MKNSFLMFACLFLFNQVIIAAEVDTALTYSKSMKKNIKAVVIKPDNYKTGKAFPVVYLLHGAGGSYAEWARKVPGIKDLADQYQFIIVCPDGNVTSWYFDSPVDPAWKYETYVATELVSYIDGHYKTIATKKGRAITGLSMGGHGALYLAIKHQDVYGAVGSMSGGVDIKPFPNGWEISKRLGKQDEFPERWKQNSVIDMIYQIKPGALAIAFECGVDDFFYKMNVRLHDELLYNNIQHDFTTRPGVHNWDYWANAIKFQSVFLSNYFNQKP
ncbi:S-formylglutathione hydrolase FrmB [Pedobacter suwonensis]|uniref:S-formylglutathione hydrolase FrmB n=1 Tax=Pedobacter suwonensis TaxID=332999 RepID=A0A1I0SM05_9SPHI|nr:alpha/beta hydrolase family protein [Pedobacter suwonensis]SFA40443.1 S-formylglutathione hydrolase FrmB [Pedobacter suwonensis]